MTPRESGCADDCCHPDHRHAFALRPEVERQWRREWDELMAANVFLAAATGITLPLLGMVEPEPDTHDEGRRLNDAE